jgi:hypothetical protein
MLCYFLIISSDFRVQEEYRRALCLWPGPGLLLAMPTCSIADYFSWLMHLVYSAVRQAFKFRAKEEECWLESGSARECNSSSVFPSSGEDFKFSNQYPFEKRIRCFHELVVSCSAKPFSHTRLLRHHCSRLSLHDTVLLRVTQSSRLPCFHRTTSVLLL